MENDLNSFIVIQKYFSWEYETLYICTRNTCLIVFVFARETED